MKNPDKTIWNDAYLEEIRGLQANNTWDTITEEEYNSIRYKVKALLPTMAISTINFMKTETPNEQNTASLHLETLIAFTGLKRRYMRRSCQ